MGLNAFSWITLIVFFAVVACVIRPFKIRIPQQFLLRFFKFLYQLRIIDKDYQTLIETPHHFTLDLRTAPFIGVIFLLATTSIDGSVVRLGFAGEDGIRPYDVLALFIVLAYMSLALDTTGLLRSTAFYVSNKGGPSGSRLYLYFFCLFFGCALVFGNDPVVLSGTPFLAYFTRASGIIPPTAWTLSEFWAANIASAVLVSSNPTNVLLAGAFELNFLTGYTKYTILPAIVSGICGYVILYLIFSNDKIPSMVEKFKLQQNNHDQDNNNNNKKEDEPDHPQHLASKNAPYIPKTLHAPGLNPKTALIDPNRAIFHTVLIVITLAVLVGTSFVPGHRVGVWMVMIPAGALAVGRELYCDLFQSKTTTKSNEQQQPVELPVRSVSTSQEQHTDTQFQNEEQVRVQDPIPPPSRITLQYMLRRLREKFPHLTDSLLALPIPVVIFAICMFILVRALVHVGWISVFAGWVANVATTPAKCVFFFGYIGAILCCPLFGTNIGATILIVQIMKDDQFLKSEAVVSDPRILTGAIFATAMGSNIGAMSLTFSSSLAGMLWTSILRRKGIIFTNREFGLWNLIPLLLLMTVANAVVLFECYYF